MTNLTPKCAVIVLAAGKGVRMQSAMPKVMHAVAGQPMVVHVLRTASALAPDRLCVVVAPGMEGVQEVSLRANADCSFAVQHEQLGTAHAVLAAESALQGFGGTVLILFGDTPLITEETLRTILAHSAKSEVVVLGMRPADPTGYGRLVVNQAGQLERIVECKDASPAEKAITLCNSGVMAVRGSQLFNMLRKVQNRNASKEYYLTDIIGMTWEMGLSSSVVEAPVGELLGVNSRAQLAQAEHAVQQRLRARAMQNGATLIAPETVFFSLDTQLGRDVVVHPFVVFGEGVLVEDGVEIRSYCHLEQAIVGRDTVMGPYARLRPGTKLEPEVHIGNFVELKQAKVGRGAKVNHLSYVGDAEIGSGANIGAGTITCNYDGFTKYKTVVGEKAFIGSNTSLVAPVNVGRGAIVGAGTVVTQDVPEDALALSRSELQVRQGAAARVREKKKKKPA